MPLPDTPMTLQGGCNCGSVRYRVEIPAKDERPIYPAGGADVDPPIRMPFSCTDHCNDCRSATGAALPCWLLTPMPMASISLVKKSADLPEGKLGPSTSDDQWVPASDVFEVDKAPEDTYLSFFASSPKRRRAFCSRCGTMFAYCIYPRPNWLEFGMLDIVLGTIDREFFELDYLQPERQVWWKVGVDWVQRFSKNGFEQLPIFPRAWVNEKLEGSQSPTDA